ncbi:MAG: DUF4783 domain-containing protein [Bacteroidota bacterium]|nr:DUF4783 domain-containing protein [Bacteroidota bacterium]
MKIRILLALTVLIISAWQLRAQKNDKDLEKISTALKEADHEKLHNYCNDMVEISVPGNEGTYSKTQAKFILRDFFREYPVKDFRIKHEGLSNSGAKFAIGEYSHQKGKMRTYFLLKNDGKKYSIHIIQFEKQ